MRLNKVIAATPLTSYLSAFRPGPGSNPSARASRSRNRKVRPLNAEYMKAINRLLLSLPPGGDVIASTKDGKFVAECKGGIVNTTHAGGYTWPPTTRLSCWAARYAARPGIAA
jgi:hypothetical protein